MSILSLRMELKAIRDCPAKMSKKEAIDQIAALASEVYDLPATHVSARLDAREGIGSTGFGHCVAIPHARIGQLNHCVGVFLRFANPIDFEAHDGKPVDLVFALLSPEKAGVDHLKALAGISRFLRDENMTAKLRGAAGPDALYALITGQREQQAA